MLCSSTARFYEEGCHMAEWILVKSGDHRVRSYMNLDTGVRVVFALTRDPNTEETLRPPDFRYATITTALGEGHAEGDEVLRLYRLVAGDRPVPAFDQALIEAAISRDIEPLWVDPKE
jgi:hypothetical protein